MLLLLECSLEGGDEDGKRGGRGRMLRLQQALIGAPPRCHPPMPAVEATVVVVAAAATALAHPSRVQPTVAAVLVRVALGVGRVPAWRCEGAQEQLGAAGSSTKLPPREFSRVVGLMGRGPRKRRRPGVDAMVMWQGGLVRGDGIWRQWEERAWGLGRLVAVVELEAR